MAARLGTCEGCDVSFASGTRGKVATRCHECRRLKNNAREAARQRARRVPPPPTPCVECRVVFNPPSRRSVYCASCIREVTLRKGREAQRQRHAYEPERAYWGRIRRDYGLTKREYQAMLAAQGGGCAICGSPDPKLKGGTHLAVDHDHETGMVRGLLCKPCNQGLANFGDSDPAMLRRAASYLERQRLRAVE